MSKAKEIPTWIKIKKIFEHEQLRIWTFEFKWVKEMSGTLYLIKLYIYKLFVVE